MPTPAPNEDQVKAIDGLTEFLSDRLSNGGKSKTLAGSAGTGKTFCMRKVKDNLSEMRKKVVFTAPSYKSTKVLREATGAECITTYSLLGLQLLPNGEVRELKQKNEDKLPIKLYDAVVVDEGSMVNSKLIEYLDRAAGNFRVPVVFLGDRCQLPPVGEDISPLWKRPLDYELTKIMRFDNQILQLADRLRKYTDFPIGDPGVKSDHDPEGAEGVWRMPVAQMIASAIRNAPRGDFVQGTAKAIAWRNVEVDRMNAILREALGTQDLSLPFSKDDRVIARSPCLNADRETVLHTDDECIVLNTIVAKHPMYPEYECFIVDLETEHGDNVAVWCVTPNAEPYLKAELKRLADEAKKNSRLWRQFWDLKEAFHDVSLAYAITAHRSQGSTYQDVYVNFSDILQNPKRAEGAKCLYVAATRASKRLCMGG